MDGVSPGKPTSKSFQHQRLHSHKIQWFDQGEKIYSKIAVLRSKLPANISNPGDPKKKNEFTIETKSSS
jgi:hypothetical protein